MDGEKVRPWRDEREISREYDKSRSQACTWRRWWAGADRTTLRSASRAEAASTTTSAGRPGTHTRGSGGGASTGGGDGGGGGGASIGDTAVAAMVLIVAMVMDIGAGVHFGLR